MMRKFNHTPMAPQHQLDIIYKFKSKIHEWSNLSCSVNEVHEWTWELHIQVLKLVKHVIHVQSTQNTPCFWCDIANLEISY